MTNVITTENITESIFLQTDLARGEMFTDADTKSVHITEAVNTCHGPSDFN